MTILEAYQILPKTEKTVIKHRFRIHGLTLRNNLGSPCHYMVTENGHELGVVQYYGGKKLSCWWGEGRDEG